MTGGFDDRDRALADCLAGAPVVVRPETFDAAMAAYRAGVAGGRRRRSRVARAAAITIVTSMSGTVAVGYAAALPDPVQRAAHRLLAPMGVPAPHKHPTGADSRRSPSTAPTVEPHDTDPSPAPSPAPALPTSVSLAPVHEVAGSNAVVTVHLSGTADPLGNVRIEAAAGPTKRWHDIAGVEVGAPGTADVILPRFDRNTWIRAVYAGVRSRPERVDVVPMIRVSWIRHGSTATVAAKVVGGRRGDAVSLLLRSGHRVRALRGRLDSMGRWSVTVALPPAGTTCTVTVAATAFHAASATSNLRV